MTRTVLLYISILFLSLFSSQIRAQSPVTFSPDSLYGTSYSPEELKEDFNFLRSSLEKIHTALYLYFPKDSLDACFDRIEAQLDQPMTDIAFFRLISPLLRLIANGHTDLQAPVRFLTQMGKGVPRFPFDLHLYKDSLFVLKNCSADTMIKEGAAILSINGETTQSVMDELASMLTRDGFNPTLPRYTVYSSFKTYYGIFKGFPEVFRIQFREPDGKIIEKEVKGLPLKMIGENRKARYDPPPKAWYQNGEKPYLLSIDDKVATMTLRTFSKGWIKSNGQNYKRFFEESFAEIVEKGVTDLILDMRWNGGGDPEPTALLFAHLYEKPVPFYKEVKSQIRKLPTPRKFKGAPPLINWYSWLLLKKKDGAYSVNSVIKSANKVWKKKHVYKGRLYVLTNPLSFSATGEMTGIIKGYDRAIFIGEEAGGNPVSNTSGVMLQTELPNTKVRATIPFVQFIMDVDIENTGRGVIPDHPVENSVWDVIEGRDATMEFTQQLIKQNQSQPAN